MRIGLISDTHGRLPTEVFDRFADVDRILHAGDVGRRSIISDLAVLAPVEAVWGNTDGWDLRAATAERVEVELGGLRFGVAHGHLVSEPDRLAELFPAADVIVHGHTHVPRDEMVGGVRFVNPGSAGPGGEGWRPSVAIGEIEGGALRVRHLDVRSGRILEL